MHRGRITCQGLDDLLVEIATDYLHASPPRRAALREALGGVEAVVNYVPKFLHSLAAELSRDSAEEGFRLAASLLSLLDGRGPDPQMLFAEAELAAAAQRGGGSWEEAVRRISRCSSDSLRPLLEEYEAPDLSSWPGEESPA